MHARKHIIHSDLLNRPAHADVVQLGSPPQSLFLLFGGSGVEEDEYRRRSETVVPTFDPLLDALGTDEIPAVLVHVTAPYDVPFNRFEAHPASADIWKTHVLTELLDPWAHLPYFVCGFSGGAALALTGVHTDLRCFGGAVLGGDALPPDFVCPEHWRERLRIYEAPGDHVCNHPENQRVVRSLEDRDQVEVFQLQRGTHRLADYSGMDCLGELLHFATRLASQAL